MVASDESAGGVAGNDGGRLPTQQPMMARASPAWWQGCYWQMNALK